MKRFLKTKRTSSINTSNRDSKSSKPFFSKKGKNAGASQITPSFSPAIQLKAAPESQEQNQ